MPKNSRTWIVLVFGVVLVIYCLSLKKTIREQNEQFQSVKTELETTKQQITDLTAQLPQKAVQGNPAEINDLVAMPEKFLNVDATVQGRLVGAPQFREQEGSFTLASPSQQFLVCYFSVQKLDPTARQVLAQSTPGMMNRPNLTVWGHLMKSSKNRSSSGYEFEVTNAQPL